MEKIKVPKNIQLKMDSLMTLNGFINKNQLAAALEISPATLSNWITHKKVPPIDLYEDRRTYWLPKTVAELIFDYRRKNNKPLA